MSYAHPTCPVVAPLSDEQPDHYPRYSVNIRNHMFFKDFTWLAAKNQLINTITIQIMVSIDR